MLTNEDFQKYKELLGLKDAPVYTPDQSVLDAQEALKQYQTKLPGDYQSAYQPKIDEMYQQMKDWADQGFTYNMNADPMYQQYKKQFASQGQKAARDVTGQMAALSGGYGNSYAAAAGNQAYQNSLGQLNNVVPELYAQAMNQYNMKGQQMKDNLSALQGQESNAFGQYQAEVGNYYTGLQASQNAYDNAYNQSYGQHQDAMDKWQYDTDLALQEYLAAQQQANYDAERAPKTGGGGGDGGKKNQQLWGKYELDKADWYLTEKQDPAAARAYIRGLGLPKDQEADMMRKIGVYTSLNGDSMVGTGFEGGKTPTPPPNNKSQQKNTPTAPLFLPPLQQINMPKYLDILGRTYR